MGRHGVFETVDDDTDTFAAIQTPKKSAVQPKNYVKYISAYRVAAQEDWRRRIGQRVRRIVRRHPALAGFLRSARSKFRHISQWLRELLA